MLWIEMDDSLLWVCVIDFRVEVEKRPPYSNEEWCGKHSREIPSFNCITGVLALWHFPGGIYAKHSMPISYRIAVHFGIKTIWGWRKIKKLYLNRKALEYASPSGHDHRFRLLHRTKLESTQFHLPQIDCNFSSTTQPLRMEYHCSDVVRSQ